MKLYKVLQRGKSCNGGDAEWNLPQKRADGSWKPGDWMEDIVGKLEPCSCGYHLCRPSDLLHWLNESIYEAEYDGEMVENEDKIVVRRCRLLSKCENWNDKTARLFACWCVRNTPLADGGTVWDILADGRSREAVDISERYAKGEATEAELRAARAAGAAARDAASAAASAAQTEELFRIIHHENK